MTLLKLKTKWFLLFVCVLVLTSCSKDHESDTELKIRYIKTAPSEKGIASPSNTNITYAPNPFTNYVTFYYTGEEEATIQIADGEGKFKKLTITDQSFNLDFSEEDEGAYYMEIKIGDEVFNDRLIKFED